jgi:hypothetical protein
MHTRFAKFVGVHKSDLHGAAFYSGLVTCGSVWTCPVCSTKIQERRRLEVAKAVEWAKKKGLQPVMVTLTFPHRSWHKLDKLIKGQAKALKNLRAGNPWKRFKEEYGFEGLIRALELTHGHRHGWHPHTHELWFVDPNVDVKAMKDRILVRWESACIRAGLLDSENEEQMKAFRLHSVDVKGNCSAADYITKWGVDHEIAKANSKGEGKGLHPFQLLAKAGQGDLRSERLFLAYSIAMKGKAQIFWSHGLKARVGVDEVNDKELADEKRDEATPVYLLPPEPWRVVCKAKAQSKILDAAETGGASAVLELLNALRCCRSP